MGHWSVSDSRSPQLQMPLPYEPRFHHREDRPNRNESTRNFPWSRWSSTTHTPHHSHRARPDGSSSSRMRYTHATFHPTRPQLICRDNQLCFQGGKNRTGLCFAVGRRYICQRPLSVRVAKQAISRVTEFLFETGLEFERASYEPLHHSYDRLESLEAFEVKRLSQFKGEQQM